MQLWNVSTASHKCSSSCRTWRKHPAPTRLGSDWVGQVWALRRTQGLLLLLSSNLNTLKLIYRLCTTRWMPPDYWQTDNSNWLVMVISNYHWLNSTSRVLILTCSAPLVQTGERKQFSLFDLDLWHTTLIYNPRLAKVKIDPHANNQGQRLNGSNRRAPTDKRTDTQKLPNILSPLLRGR